MSLTDKRVRTLTLFLVVLVAPIVIRVLLYDELRMWSVDDDGDTVKLVSLVLPAELLPAVYWGALWLAYKGATCRALLPRQLNRIARAFDQAENTLTWRYTGFGAIRERFDADLIERTDHYLAASNCVSPEQIAFAEIADIAQDLRMKELQTAAIDELNNIKSCTAGRILQLAGR